MRLQTPLLSPRYGPSGSPAHIIPVSVSDRHFRAICTHLGKHVLVRLRGAPRFLLRPVSAFPTCWIHCWPVEDDGRWMHIESKAERFVRQRIAATEAQHILTYSSRGNRQDGAWVVVFNTSTRDGRAELPAASLWENISTKQSC